MLNGDVFVSINDRSFFFSKPGQKSVNNLSTPENRLPQKAGASKGRMFSVEGKTWWNWWNHLPNIAEVIQNWRLQLVQKKDFKG